MQYCKQPIDARNGLTSVFTDRDKNGECKNRSVAVTWKLQMKITRKIGVQFNSAPKRRHFSLVKVCAFLFLPLIAANAFAQEITEFDLGVRPDDGNSWSIAAMPKGSIWLAEKGGHRIEKITPSGEVTEYKTKNTKKEEIARGWSIAPGPDGNLWLLEDSYVVRIKEDGEMTQYALPTDSAVSIYTGPDDNMSFLVGNHRIFKLNMQGAVVNKFDLQDFRRSAIVNIVAGPDGSVWYTAMGSDRIGKITRTGEITEYSEGITKDALADSIALGANGNIWFTETEIGKIAKITPSGVITEYEPLPDGIAPGELISGRDGNIWFADLRGQRIVKVTPDGAAVGYHIQNRKRIGESKNVKTTDHETGGPSDLTVDSQGNIWFVGPTMNWVGRLTVALETPPFNQSMSTQEIVDKMRAPSDPVDLMKNVKLISDAHLISQDDFYTESNLKKIFGCDTVHVLEDTRMDQNSFGTLTTLSNCKKFSVSAERSYEVTLTKSSKKNPLFKAGLTLTVIQEAGFPSIFEVESVFGSTWIDELVEVRDGPSPVIRVHAYKNMDGGVYGKTSIWEAPKFRLSELTHFETHSEND